MKRSQAWILLYAMVLLAEIIGLLADLPFLHFYCKPLLMPLLVVGLFSNRRAIGKNPWLWIVAALCLSWGGDLFLLFEDSNRVFFISGLGSFLLAHICYIIYFFKCGASLPFAWRNNKLWIGIILVFLIILLALLIPKLGSLLVPVIIYSTVLILMLISSIGAIPAVKKSASWFFVTGAISFVLSDAALAMNKFYQPFPLAGVIIMMTYGIAQWLITTGGILNHEG